jgi:hypothetical protein
MNVGCHAKNNDGSFPDLFSQVVSAKFIITFGFTSSLSGEVNVFYF